MSTDRNGARSRNQDYKGNMSSTNKKGTFRFNFKQSAGGCPSGMLNTPLGRSQLISSQN